MSDFKVGQHITVKLCGGRLVDAEIKAIIDTTEGKRLQVSFGNDETARDLSLADRREGAIKFPDEIICAMAALRIQRS
jgi:hypothetical protein